jgi:FMN-dependent NADH-azoreductase
MRRLLHIDASPRGARSRSGVIGHHLLQALQAQAPELEVSRLGLFEADLPAFDKAAIEGRYGLLMGVPVPPAQREAWAQLQAIADHFLSFDTWLFTVPMWNFGLPYRLKQYIDLITHPQITFRNDAAGNVEGLAAGHRAIVVAASAMPFGSDPAIAGLDFQLSYRGERYPRGPGCRHLWARRRSQRSNGTRPRRCRRAGRSAAGRRPGVNQVDAGEAEHRLAGLIDHRIAGQRGAARLARLRWL